MQRNYFGVLTKEKDSFILFTHKSEIDLSQELKDLWKKEIPVHIIIESEERSLMNEDKCELYYDKDKDNKYKLHINDVNIEEILNKSLYKRLDITLTYRSEDSEYGTKLLHKS
jgi:hypothetical protein